MTVKDLIIQLLDCELDSDVLLGDDVEIETKNGKMDGSVYDIISIEPEADCTFFNFNNRNHYKKVKGMTNEEAIKEDVWKFAIHCMELGYGVDILKLYTASEAMAKLEKFKKLEQEPSVQPKAKTEWIPTKWHKVTDEEREREGYPKEITFMLDGSMPSDEQEVLICLKNGYVEKDTCYYGEDGYFTDNGYDWIEDIVAWMPLPEPYKAESEG